MGHRGSACSAMVVPRVRWLIASMANATAPFELLLRRATGPSRLAPLLDALGFGRRAAIVDPDAWSTLGLVCEPSISSIRTAAAGGGVHALVIELVLDAPADSILRIARRIRQHDRLPRYLLIFGYAGWRHLVFGSFGLGGELRRLDIDRSRPIPSDLEALEELVPAEGEQGIALLVRHARALDRTRLTRQFFGDFRAQRGQVSRAWLGLPPADTADRDQLALLLLCRLMFLYFLQQSGHLAGDTAYLAKRLRAWQRRRGDGSFFRNVLDPLFFGALNTRPERRSPGALSLGALPYLNGGLFERHALERRHGDLDLPDDILAGILENLFERYRFTGRDAAEGVDDGTGPGIDPEMLGRVFEGLMAAHRRGSTGTFYTPAPVVDRLVREALETWLADPDGVGRGAARALVHETTPLWLPSADEQRLESRLRDLRILDPACGSGAFLLGALARLARIRGRFGDGPAVRREIIGRTLHGVDVQEDAALLCALRLWLSLAVGTAEPGVPVPPLPNLDRQIRQGDALVDPLDLGAPDGVHFGSAAVVRRALREIEPLAIRYLAAEPSERPGLQEALAAAERTLALGWIEVLESKLRGRRADLGATAFARDLFGGRATDASRAEAAWREVETNMQELARLRSALYETGALPFFSFPVHFPEPASRGFDMILSNPPWIRAHGWPAAAAKQMRRRYEVCRDAGWRRGAALSGAPGGVAAQVDLSLLFLEKSLRLLAPGGVLAMLLPAKALRSLYGSGARRLLLRETRLTLLEDHSLDHRSIFRADAFTAAVVAKKVIPGDSLIRSPPANPEATIRVTMVRRGVDALGFEIPPADLPIVSGDEDSPWLIAPPAVAGAIRRMQAAGAPLGTDVGLRVRRGVVTGANDVLIAKQALPKLGDLALIRTEGHRRAGREGRAAAEIARYEALVEASALRPLIRGSDISAWKLQTSGHVIWAHEDAAGRPSPVGPRTELYLRQHEAVLRQRSGWREILPLGAVFRVSVDTLGPKVAWHDIAADLKAVALPARVAGLNGTPVPLVPLNTVYFAATGCDDDALLLAAYLNALPARVFARAVAERAKDARFRFQAWTLALLPLPPNWRHGRAAERMRRLSHEAHQKGCIHPAHRAELDQLAGQLHGLTPEDLSAMAGFDRWLRGER